MKSRLFVAGTILLCFGAYFAGRGYQRAQRPLLAPVARPTPAPSATPAPPPEFGRSLQGELADISFVDLYETLSSARPAMREEWLRQIEETPETPRKVAALCAFFRALVQIDPKEAGDLVVNVPRHRGPAMDALLSAAPPSAMPQLLDMMLKLPEIARNFALTDHLGILLDEWGQVDPQATARFLDAHKDGTGPEYTSTLLETWAGIDPVESRKWAEAHQEELVDHGNEEWLRGWFSGDPQAAIKYGLAHRNDPAMAPALSGLAGELFEQDHAAAKELIEQLPDPKMREEALDRIAGRYAWSNPDDDDLPSQGAEFLSQFPVEIWPQQFAGVLERWERVDATTLFAWVSSLPPEKKDAVLGRFPVAESYAPELTLLPVLELPASTMRTQLLRRVAQGLKSDDRPLIERINSLKLSPEQKAELTQLIGAQE